MIVCQKHKLLYLCPPKTGSVSIVRKLKAAPFDGELADATYAHHNSVWLPEYADYFIFMTVRHPYLRMLSFWRFHQSKIAEFGRGELQGADWAWWHKVTGGKPLSFEEFLAYDVMQEPFKTVWSCGWHAQVVQKPINIVVRMEHFEDDLKRIYLLKDVDFGHLNRGPEKNQQWHEYFTPGIVLKIQELWPDDFEPFGYVKDFDACREGRLFDSVKPTDELSEIPSWYWYKQ